MSQPLAELVSPNNNMNVSEAPLTASYDPIFKKDRLKLTSDRERVRSAGSNIDLDDLNETRGLPPLEGHIIQSKMNITSTTPNTTTADMYA